MRVKHLPRYYRLNDVYCQDILKNYTFKKGYASILAQHKRFVKSFWQKVFEIKNPVKIVLFTGLSRADTPSV